MFYYNFTIDLCPPSVNFQYRPAFSGRYNRFKRMFSPGHAYLYLDPQVSDFKESLKEQLQPNISKIGEFPPKSMLAGIFSYYRLGMDFNTFWNRDVTNAVKATEDAIFECFSYDDSEVIFSAQYKKPLLGNLIEFHIGLITFDDLEGIDIEKKAINFLLNIKEKKERIIYD